MRVRVAGPSLADGRGRRFGSGQVVEVEDRVGAAWIAHRLAERVDITEEDDREDPAAAPRPPAAEAGPAGGAAPGGRTDAAGALTPLGGGWYRMPDGSRVRGRDAALNALGG